MCVCLFCLFVFCWVIGIKHYWWCMASWIFGMGREIPCCVIALKEAAVGLRWELIFRSQKFESNWFHTQELMLYFNNAHNLLCRSQWQLLLTADHVSLCRCWAKSWERMSTFSRCSTTPAIFEVAPSRSLLCRTRWGDKWACCLWWTGSSEIGSPPALELNPWFLFPVHFLFCFSVSGHSLFLFYFCLTDPFTCIYSITFFNQHISWSRNVTTCVVAKR